MVLFPRLLPVTPEGFKHSLDLTQHRGLEQELKFLPFGQTMV